MMMDSWPLAVQWALVIALTFGFFGTSLLQARAPDRADGDAPQTVRAHVAMMMKFFGVSDWAVTFLLAVFLISLTVRTIAG